MSRMYNNMTFLILISGFFVALFHLWMQEGVNTKTYEKTKKRDTNI